MRVFVLCTLYVVLLCNTPCSMQFFTVSVGFVWLPELFCEGRCGWHVDGKVAPREKRYGREEGREKYTDHNGL